MIQQPPAAPFRISVSVCVVSRDSEWLTAANASVPTVLKHLEIFICTLSLHGGAAHLVLVSVVGMLGHRQYNPHTFYCVIEHWALPPKSTSENKNMCRDYLSRLTKSHFEISLDWREVGKDVRGQKDACAELLLLLMCPTCSSPTGCVCTSGLPTLRSN